MSIYRFTVLGIAILACSVEDESPGRTALGARDAAADIGSAAAGGAGSTDATAGTGAANDAGSDISSGGGGGGIADCDDGTLVLPYDPTCRGDTGSAGAVACCDSSFDSCSSDGGAAGSADAQPLELCEWMGNQAIWLVAHHAQCCAREDPCDLTHVKQCFLNELADACERPPLCLPDGGTFGCTDVARECPALTEADCHDLFDGLTFESRMAVMQCFRVAGDAAADCVTSFRRCVLGPLASL